MNTYIKLVAIISALILFNASAAFAETDIKKSKKETTVLIPATAIKNVSEPAKVKELEKNKALSKKNKEKAGKSKSGQNFTGTGPAMARDNPDA